MKPPSITIEQARAVLAAARREHERRLTLRVPPELLDRITNTARERGQSINQFCSGVLDTVCPKRPGAK